MSLELQGYERYKLEWMIEHGYSLKDLMDALTQQEGYLNIKQVFNDWESYAGFEGSEIWACKEEWEDNENQEDDYISYNIGFINEDGMEDETQFDIDKNKNISETISELMELFKDFCKENNIKNINIIYIEEE